MTDSPVECKPNGAHCPAIILCGGRSRRMGRDKARLPLGSETVLQRVETAFRAISGQLVLVIGRDATAPTDTGFHQIVHDENLDFGPLEGLRVGLAAIARESAMVFVGTCDAPLVVPGFYEAMFHRLNSSSEFDAVMPLVNGRHHPLTAIYRPRVLDAIESMVGNSELRVRDLLKKIRVLEMDETELRQADPMLNTIRNINTREEYEDILKGL